MLLAPVVKERKGEHVKLLQGLQAQGFVRARIDGEVVELDSPPPLDLRRKHTIEVVVDRFKVRDDLGQRLAESFETALTAGQKALPASRFWMSRNGRNGCFPPVMPARSAVTA
jgi:excinuclease ABC subunit A